MLAIGNLISEDVVDQNFNTYYDVFLGPNAFLSAGYYICAIPWIACFREIYVANLVLEVIDQFTGATDDERDNVRAQMLALRSHAYWRLMQMYGPRWNESRGGATLCAPIETTFSTENKMASSMSDILAQCYEDLDKAIGIFERTGFKRENIIQPDLKVAKGIKMRLALLSEDWELARNLSKELLDGAAMTTNEDLTSGFFEPADSWLWGAWNNTRISDEFSVSLYYWSMQSFEACNGTYPAHWNYAPAAISKDLYMRTDENDVRRSLYVMPDQLFSVYKNMSYWYKSENYSETDMRLNKSESIIRYFDNRKPAGVEYGAFQSAEPYMSPIPVALGSHVKFYQPGTSQHSDAAIVFMRTEEILLTYAEASCRLGYNNDAVESLNKLRQMRIESYEMLPANTPDLLGEIQLERKIELWGEGHSWFDQKRWNLPIVRRHYVSGDPDSGNWRYNVATELSVDAGNGWRIPVPLIAITTNPLLDTESMGYVGVEGYQTVSPTAKPATPATANMPTAKPATAKTPKTLPASANMPKAAKPSDRKIDTPSKALIAR